MEELKTEITNAKGSIYLDCYSSNCPPCKILSPIFDQTAKDFAFYGTFIKGCLENIPEFRDRYTIKSIPTLLILEDRKEIARKNSLTEILEYLQSFK